MSVRTGEFAPVDRDGALDCQFGQCRRRCHDLRQPARSDGIAHDERSHHASPQDAQLTAAFVQAVGKIDMGATRRIGMLLARVEGFNLPSGFRVERESGSGDVVKWRVIRV